MSAKSLQCSATAALPAIRYFSMSASTHAPSYPPTSLGFSPRSGKPLRDAEASYNSAFESGYNRARELWDRPGMPTPVATRRFARGSERERPSRSPGRKLSLQRAKSSLSSPSSPQPPPSTAIKHLLSLADLKTNEIEELVHLAMSAKWSFYNRSLHRFPNTLMNRTIALIFSKRSTRTRVSAESAIQLMGGNPMFLGKDDIQLGVNESLRDSATVIGSMTDGIFARVYGHEDVEALAEHSPVPVINALSDLYHPLQILADLQTLVEHYAQPDYKRIRDVGAHSISELAQAAIGGSKMDRVLKGKRFVWVGDTNNITNELLVTLPRFGMRMVVASPNGYNKVDPRVLEVLKAQGTESLIEYTDDPKKACQGADIVATDTWISMGQEEETAVRKKAFDGFRVTNDLCANANPDWVFMHCLPRHQEEVDDEVFYGPRSLIFPEAENRKWTAFSTFYTIFGNGIQARRGKPAMVKGAEQLDTDDD